MAVDSHIINSRFLIDQFRISPTDGQVFTLNLKNLKLSRKGPKELGVEFGYYDDDAEQYLSHEYEGPLSQLLHRIIDDNDYQLSQDERDLIADFLVVMYARNPDILPKTYAKSILAKELNITITASDIVRICGNTNLRNLFFDDHCPMIIINNSSVGFVSSIYGCSITYNKITGKTCWLLPLTPRLAIQFINNDDWEKRYNKIPIGEINEEEAEYVRYFNNQIADSLDSALSSAIDDSHDIYYLFSNNDVELKRLKNKYKKKGKTK